MTLQTRKAKIPIVLSVAVLAFGAYTLGTKAGGGDAGANRAAPGGGPGMHGPPGLGPGPDQLAERLGVSAGELRGALDDVRKQLAPKRDMRDGFAEELADALGKSEAEVSRALEQIRVRHRAEMKDMHDEFVAALAKRLGVDESKVEDALPDPPQRGGPGPGLGPGHGPPPDLH
jgi:hypothetical protein